ncbi:MAG: hypothetical protein GDA42_10235, partial [Ekhidna sp.]|nr:hypothetical protein [Ekhidna sp.]
MASGLITDEALTGIFIAIAEFRRSFSLLHKLQQTPVRQLYKVQAAVQGGGIYL